MSTPLLSIDRVTKRFAGLVAINNLSIDIQAGEAHGLMGPNGAGKTTLIGVISGKYRPEEGSVSFMGGDITSLSPHTVCRLGITRTHQIPQPFTHLTVHQNIAVGAMYGNNMRKSAAMAEVDKVIEIMDLVDKKDVRASDLEALTLKRLELARALATNPKILLIDEVAAGLTDVEIPRFMEILKRIRSMGITYIMVEHVLKVLLKAVERVTVIDRGAKLAEGPPNEVMEDEKVIKAYLG